MPRPTRVFDDPDAIFFVTNRCFQERLLLRPSRRVNAIILGCMARAARRYEVEIFGFVILSNHFHFLIRSRKQHLNRFMGLFQGQLAKEMNRLLYRTGAFFARRYSAEQVLDDDALLDRYSYIANNPCAADLVAEPSEWPGLLSHSALMAGEKLVGTWIDRTELARLRRRSKEYVPESAAERSFEIELAPLPAHEALDEDSRRQSLDRAVASETRRLEEERRIQGRRVMGARKVLAQDPRRRPSNPKRSQRPPCHASCDLARKAHIEHVLNVTRAHGRAVQRWLARRGTCLGGQDCARRAQGSSSSSVVAASANDPPPICVPSTTM